MIGDSEMDDRRTEIDMGFTKELFPEGTHMCLIYDDDAQRKEVIGQFLAKGIALGEKVAYYTDTTPPQDEGVTFSKDGSKGKCDVFDAVDAYCPHGEFVPSEMIAKLCSCYTDAIDAGYTGMRVSGDASWALRGIPGSERLLEYEAMVNTAVRGRRIIPLCQYDSRRFDGTTILNVLRVHPFVIVRGQVVQNPFYITPEEFFRERGIEMKVEDHVSA
jgi:hypothetical protein